MCFFFTPSQIQTPFSGIVRVSMLPHPWDEESDAMLRAHAYAYPRAGKVAFDVTGDEVVIRCVYAFVCLCACVKNSSSVRFGVYYVNAQVSVLQPQISPLVMFQKCALSLLSSS